MEQKSSRQFRSVAVVTAAVKASVLRERGKLRRISPIRTIAGFTFCFGVSGCVSYVPVDEWTLARASYEAARDADAPRFVPALWFKAEQSYREAQRAYKDRSYSEAQHLFQQAQFLSEQAENAARLARYQSGEVVP